jgi:hypothetical protein
MAFDLDTVNEFEAITQFPLIAYLQAFDRFIKKDVTNIISYYSGNINSLDNNSFSNLKDLISETQKIFDVFTLNKSVFSNYRWWLFIADIELYENALMMVDNSSKWLRSTISNGNFNPNPEIDIPFSQGQTLESIERNTLGSQDWDNTWPNLAIKNDLREEDYTSEAGFLIKANFDYILNNFKINSIVDNPVGDNVLGKDIASTLIYDVINNDLTVLSPEDTFTQNVTILINLRKGDNPEFPTQGINPKLVVGSNVNSLNYPILFRQLSALFRGDDTIKSFTLISINRISDSVSISFNVESRIGDIQLISLQA